MKNKSQTLENNVQILGQLRSLTTEQIKSRIVEFEISNENVDRYKTVFLSSGWHLENYMKNPVVCYNHLSYGSDPDTIIGHTVKIFTEDKKLIAQVQFESAEDNALAEKVFKKLQNGTLNMASVSAIVHKGHWGNAENGEDETVYYFDNQELLEWSIVSIPGNADAAKRHADTIKRFTTPEEEEEKSPETDKEELIAIPMRLNLAKHQYNLKKRFDHE